MKPILKNSTQPNDAKFTFRLPAKLKTEVEKFGLDGAQTCRNALVEAVNKIKATKKR